MNRCKECRYGFDSGMDNIIGCQYLLHKHEERGCPAGDGCTRFESTGGKPRNTIRYYKKERKQMKKLTEENKREIITLRASGMKVTEIAQKFSVDKTSIYNIIKNYNEHGENAFTAATDTEKEPAAAATVTDSEQETCIDIPADIIPDNSENVKPVSEEKDEPLIPQSVIEACWGRIDDLRQQIAAEQTVIDDWERQIAEIKEFLELARIANPVGSTA